MGELLTGVHHHGLLCCLRTCKTCVSGVDAEIFAALKLCARCGTQFVCLNQEGITGTGFPVQRHCCHIQRHRASLWVTDFLPELSACVLTINPFPRDSAPFFWPGLCLPLLLLDILPLLAKVYNNKRHSQRNCLSNHLKNSGKIIFQMRIP